MGTGPVLHILLLAAGGQHRQHEELLGSVRPGQDVQLQAVRGSEHAPLDIGRVESGVRQRAAVPDPVAAGLPCRDAGGRSGLPAAGQVLGERGGEA